MPSLDTKVQTHMLSAIALAMHGKTFDWKMGNTWVSRTPDESEPIEVRLHGHLIAMAYSKDGKLDRLCISMAGWNTNTTRARLNYILTGLHVNFYIGRVKGITWLHDSAHSKVHRMGASEWITFDRKEGSWQYCAGKEQPR